MVPVLSSPRRPPKQIPIIEKSELSHLSYSFFFVQTDKQRERGAHEAYVAKCDSIDSTEDENERHLDRKQYGCHSHTPARKKPSHKADPDHHLSNSLKPQVRV